MKLYPYIKFYYYLEALKIPYKLCNKIISKVILYNSVFYMHANEHQNSPNSILGYRLILRINKK